MGKSITIKGEEYFYIVYSDADEWSGLYYWTEFYKKTESVPKWKFFSFQSKEFVNRPIVIFKIDYNIEDASYTKDTMNRIVMNAYNLYLRKDEIKRGELI